MRVLILQTSPFGDIVDTLPALTDAVRAYPNVIFDWVVETAYQEVPAWHPAVERVIPTAIRRWRKHFWQALHSPEWRQFKTQLRKHHYDLVIDCQGLIRSAVISKLVKAPVVGWTKNCAREKAAAWFYQRHVAVNSGQPRIQTLRLLFAKALGYQVPETNPDFGIERQRFCGGVEEAPNLVFIHAASRKEKLYPEASWQELITSLRNSDIRIRLPWGNETEKARAERLTADNPNVEVLPKLNLQGLACVLVQATAVVAVDTGLGHLSAALGVPTVSLYNFANSDSTIVREKNAIHLYPSLSNHKNEQEKNYSIVPSSVLSQLYSYLPARKHRREAG